jgi:hypothetical protein
VQGKVQATTGIDLAALPDLMLNLFPAATGDETSGMLARRAEGRQDMSGIDMTMPATITNLTRLMGQAVADARTGVAAYVQATATAPAPASDKLIGLVALLTSYLAMGKQGLVSGYAKTIAPVMGRTDFATMFTMLPKAEKAYYASGKGQPFLDLFATVTGNTLAEMQAEIYSGGILRSTEPNDWYLDLTRNDWLQAIPAKPGKVGKDKLTPKNFPSKRGRQSLEGLGSYAKKVDKVTLGDGSSVKVPIVELRSLPMMNPTDFSTFAVKLARLVAFLNEGQDKTYGEV